VEFYRTTIGLFADESNSLAEESVVFRQFSTRFIFRSILEYLDNTRNRSTLDVLCIVVFGKESDFGKVDSGLANENTHAFTLQLII
jgi:hypothetical protein